MNAEDIQNYDGSLEMLEDEYNVSKVPTDKLELPPDNTKQKQVHGSRLKFKDQGILAQSSVYLRDDVDKEIVTQHRSADNKLKGNHQNSLKEKQ